MADYFIRISGSDSNDGTTPSTAWRTFGKALGAAGISSGDRLFIGAGTYREFFTVNMTSATAETLIFGDVDGIYTGDAGEVIISNYLTNDETLPFSNSTITLNGRDYLTFQNLILVGYTASAVVNATTQTSTNIIFRNCIFNQLSNPNAVPGINLTVGFGVNASWLIEGCSFLSIAGGSVTVTLVTGTGSDYDANVVIRNCYMTGRGTISITSSGTSAQEGGGVIIENCICQVWAGSNTITVSTTRVGGSTFTYPVIVRNCLLFGGGGSTCLSVGELGALIENYNILIVGSTARTNVAIGPQSVSDGSVAPLFELGQSFLFNWKPRPFLSPLKHSPLLGHGNRTTAPVKDLLNNNTIDGNVNFIDQGTVTNFADRTITDTTKRFGNDNLKGYNIRLLDGQAAGYTKTIFGSTNTTISGDGLWPLDPQAGDKYVIYSGPTALHSKVSSGISSTFSSLLDNFAVWGNNFWQGYTCEIISGTAAGARLIISGNNVNTLSGYGPWSTTPASGDIYALYWGSGTSASGTDYIHAQVGCYGISNDVHRETGIILSGSNSIKLFGPNFYDFKFPVSGNTTVGIYGYYDNRYSGVKPQLIIKNGRYIGVPDTTGTMVGASGQWEAISLNLTPTAPGVLTARVQSNATGVGGTAYFDNFFFS